MYATHVLAIGLLCSNVAAQISQKDACQKYSDAVVRIDARIKVDAESVSHGTGFIVSPDGWIFTARHVVISPETGNPYEGISVTLADGSIEIAKVIPIDPRTAAQLAGQDVSILKVERTKLPSLDLGEKADDIVIGSDLTIIGFPFSAIAFSSTAPGIKDKFCLSGSVASSGSTDVSITSETPKKTETIKVNVDVIYFQGPSVKGLSGGPIISRDTGHVIAILTNKLTGISVGLAAARDRLTRQHGEMTVGGVGVLHTESELIDTLDAQLANGLGAGTGVETPKYALRSILRQHSNRR